MNFLTNGMQKNAKFYAHAISNFDFNEFDKCCMYTDIFYLISNKLLLKLRTKKTNLLHNNKYTELYRSNLIKQYISEYGQHYE